MLKLVVPVALGEPASVAGAAYGSIERPCSGHEEPMVHWVDLSDAAAGWGLACIAEGSGGYDALGSTLRLTVLRSPQVADHGLGWGADDPAGYPVTDQGRPPPAVSPRPPPRPGRCGATAPACRGVPDRAAGRARHLAPGAARARGLGGAPPGRQCDHAGPQRAEDGGGSVARLWEVAGRHQHVRLSFGSGGSGLLPVWEGELRPHEVRTIFVPDNDPAGSRCGGHPRLRRARGRPVRLRGPPRAPSGPDRRSAPGPGCARAPDAHDRGRRHDLRRRQRRQRGGRGAHRRRAHEGHGAPAAPRRPRRATLREHAPEAMAGEAGYLADRLEGAIRAVCLTSQSGLLSAIANDTAGDMGMAQQLHGYGRPHDLFWALSTSGRSRNVVLAALAARAAGVVSWPSPAREGTASGAWPTSGSRCPPPMSRPCRSCTNRSTTLCAPPWRSATGRRATIPGRDVRP